MTADVLLRSLAGHRQEVGAISRPSLLTPLPTGLPKEAETGMSHSPHSLLIVATGSGLASEVPLGDITLRIEVRGLRYERTGLHGALYIYWANSTLVPLAWSYLNLDRDEDRGRLARKAYNCLCEEIGDKPTHPGTGKAITAQDLVTVLDRLCLQVWPAYLRAERPQPLDPEMGTAADPIVDPPLLLRGGGAILYAPPGVGKSYTALALAVAVDAGVAMGPLRPRQAIRSLFVNLERPAQSVRRRLYHVNAALGLDPRRPLLVFANARGRTLADILPVLEQTIEEEEIGFVVIDSISRAGMGSLREDEAATRIMDSLNRLQVAWLAISHTPRSDSSHIFGSIMLDAAADICIQALSQRQDDRLAVGLKVTKANDIPIPMRFPIICYEFGDMVLRAIRAARPGEFPDIEKERTADARSLVLELLADQGPLPAEEAAEALGYARSYVSSILNRLEQEGKLKSFRVGRQLLYGLVPQQGAGEALFTPDLSPQGEA